MKRPDFIALFFLASLTSLFFAPVIFGGQVLVPFDNLFRFPPWSSFATQFGITTPHNELVLDLVLENYVWKNFIVGSLRAHELPLWNPYLFAGLPFLAAGQHSALYPLSALFYILPVERAYGYFVALQIAIAAFSMYGLGRVFRFSRVAATFSAIVYSLSSFMIVSTTFPMVLSVVAWLPAILACIEIIIEQNPDGHGISLRQITVAIVGSVLLGVQFLAGHVEFSLYLLFVSGLFTLWRGIACGIRRSLPRIVLTAGMVVVGMALGAVQLVPLYELVQSNFRSGSVTYQDVVGWAFPLKQIATFIIPDFFGNPTHHSYVDIFDWTVKAAPSGTVFWGIKNYVEAGSYLGILPLVLAVVTVIGLFRSEWRKALPGPGTLAFFAVLAVISLLFVFGTPLYALLFFGIPGFNQLHSPFRWVMPYTLCVAVLAGAGLDSIGAARSLLTNRLGRVTRYLLILGGGLALAALGASILLPDLVTPLADRVLKTSTMASAVFDSGRMFYAYEWPNFALFAALVLGSGIVFALSGTSRQLSSRFGSIPLWQAVAVGLVAADLFLVGYSFYPKTDPQLATFVPPSIKFLQQDNSLYRITSYDVGGLANEKVFNANAGMLFGISDIRGYDSIIPKQYADVMGLLAPQNELLANRIAPFYEPDALSSPILNLLNVKYVLTKRPVPNAGYTLVYDGEIQIYRNDRVLPRAFIVPRAQVEKDRTRLLGLLKQFDPAQEVLLEQDPAPEAESVSAVSCDYAPVTVDHYSANQVDISSRQACAGWLVLSDSYFPGWVAQLDGQDTSLYRADYNFRAVYLPAGTHTVRFKYSPISFRVGGIASFLGGMFILMGIAYVAWRRFYRPANSSSVGVIAKNSLLPMATSLLMKAMDIAFAMFCLRILGPTGQGRYAWAVNLWFFANTIADFGLGILLTREVTKDRSQANRYLTTSLVLRAALWALSLIPFGILGYIFGVAADTSLAIWLLLLGILPSTLSGSLAFLFNAYEQFEYRVAIDMLTRIVSISLGVVALLLGNGIVGLAAASIATNLFTLTAFYILVRMTLFKPSWQFDSGLVRQLISDSYPLMLNNLLSSLFFRVDVFILQPLKGDAVLGYYSTAYKFIDALNFIPSNFTLAIFPALSRMASSAKDALLRAYILSLKILLWIALPITVGTIFVSRELITIFGGVEYLPHSAAALQVLIWFLPFSFINSVTHYVLIALGQQRFLTKAFVIGLMFNLVANLIAIPPLGYIGAALVTILSELVLLVPFYYSVQKNLASVPFFSIAWRPAAASAIMGLVLWFMVARAGLLIAVPVSGIVYVALLLASGALGEEEQALLRRVLPVRLHRLARIGKTGSDG